MSTFAQSEYDAYKKAVSDVAKKIGNYQTRELPAEPAEREQRIEQYKTELTESYNNFVSYISLHLTRILKAK